MSTSQLEIRVQDRGYGTNNVLEINSIPGNAGSVLVRVKHTETRKDDDNPDEVTWWGIEANLEELRNAVTLMEGAEYKAHEDDGACTGCGRP